MNIIRNLKVKKIIKKIDKNIKVRFGKVLECEPRKNKIFIAYETNEVDKKTFLDYVKELDSQCHFDDITLGILHEIGHIYTYEEQNEEEYRRDTKLLRLLFKEKKLSAKQLNEFYVRLPLEANATKWAIDFAMQNKKFCKYYQNKIGKEISK